MDLEIQELAVPYAARKSMEFCVKKNLTNTTNNTSNNRNIMGAGAISSPRKSIVELITDADLEEEFHSCPNADISACEYCKLLNNLVILNRTFKTR